MPQTNDKFYSSLPENKIKLRDLLIRDNLFNKVPDNWQVIITDIKNSTAAVQNGQHETVNLIATGSIVTVLNIAYKANILVPFFFGGDGATFIIPPVIVDQVMTALLNFQKTTLANFNLDIRAGILSVKSIYENGHDLRITKFKSSRTLSIPIILGTGISYAERIIKADDYLYAEQHPDGAEPDLRGMECRWDKIGPPIDHHEIVTLLAVADASARQSEAFRKVMILLDDIYGPPETRQPISIPKLQLNTTFSRIEMEMRAKLEGVNFFRRIYTWLTHNIAYLYFRTRRGKAYLRSLVNRSDTLVIDGRINTVISGTESQRIQLQEALNKLEEAGEIKFGICVSQESVMSCYVRDLKDAHIHFVDGAEGGYTNAAGALKRKLNDTAHLAPASRKN